MDYNLVECYICCEGGDLSCCNFCEKSFHLECHIPPLSEVPHGMWKCCECSAVEEKHCSKKSKDSIGCGRGNRNSSHMHQSQGSNRPISKFLQHAPLKITRFREHHEGNHETSTPTQGTRTHQPNADACKLNSVDTVTKNQDPKELQLQLNGWKIKIVVENDINRKHWLTPILSIEFKYKKTALEFDIFYQKCCKNEEQAWTEFIQVKKQLGIKVSTFIVGGIKAIKAATMNCESRPGSNLDEELVTGPQRLTTTSSLVKQISYTRTTRRNRANTQAMDDQKDIQFNEVVQIQEIPQKCIPLSSHDSVKKISDLKETQLYLDGWKLKNITCNGINRKHWLTPVLNIEFKSKKAAIEFDLLYQKYDNNEEQAWKDYVQEKNQLGVKLSTFIVGGVKTLRVSSTMEFESRDVSNLMVEPTESLHRNPTTTKEVALKQSKSRFSVKQDSIIQQRQGFESIKKQSNNQSNIVCTSLQESLIDFSVSVPTTPANEIDGEGIQCIKSGPLKLTFFNERFKGRVLLRKHCLSDMPPEKTFFHNGFKYELASCKVDRKCGQLFYFQKTIDLIYIAVQGRDMTTINLQEELEKLCGFGSLGGKVRARLRHLQSQVKSIHIIDYFNIERIEENGNEGCGFVPAHFFQSIESKKYQSLQVRIVAPKLGLIKGMLLEKRGISRIQIPDSMIKAGPSSMKFLGDNNVDWAIVMVKNYFPTTENSYHGRLLDPAANAPKSFEITQRKALSEMHIRMLIGFGIPKFTVNAYVTRSRCAKSMKHSHLKGVADPTGKIPYGKVFISGYTTNANNDRDLFGRCLRYQQVYVSRSPCLEPIDAKLLSVIESKPKDMIIDDWNHLCSFKFGTIIFGSPFCKSDIPLPCLIADGDLDGDDYFVLWDEQILDHILTSTDKLMVKSRKLLQELKLPERVKTNVDKSLNVSKEYDRNWLCKAQDEMLDFEYQKVSSDIVGKLWSLSIKASERRNDSMDIYDDDACAYAKAYKDAMDIQKHGGKIYLPQHLCENVSHAHKGLLVSGTHSHFHEEETVVAALGCLRL